jgi:predicted dehydrogenase
MKSEWSRRHWLRSVGTTVTGGILAGPSLTELVARPIVITPNPAFRPPERPLTAIVCGAGNRGNVYASYAAKYPDELRMVGVAEPIRLRNDRFAAKYGVADEHRFDTWERIFDRPKFADAVFITTPDHLHYGPAMAALGMGYDLILEKPIAQTWKECADILDLAVKKDRIVAVCHVLRYAPYFRKMKEVAGSGAIGRLISVQHMEPVEHIHMSHSFVRGNWRRTAESNFMLLAKSCHDMDLLRWIIDKPCTKAASFGSLAWFRPENAPAGSTPRCTDGCAAEPECPYSALKIYYKNRTWLHHFDLPAEGDKGPTIMENLKNGPYGRCVYRCDNDVVDHQTVMLEFGDGITVTFNMEAHTSYAGRRTRIMGSMGDIVGDEDDLYVANFRTGETARWNTSENSSIVSGHGGGDHGLVHDFIQASSQHNPALLTSSISASMESHLMAFRAEESRLGGGVLEVKI